MDLWAPFREATLAALPDAAGKIVYDRFHVTQILIDALDTVRAAEHRARRRAGDRQRGADRRLWWKSRETLTWRQRRRLTSLRKTRPKTARAWDHKEQFRQLWSYTHEGWARRFWQRWYARAVRSRLPAIVRAAKRLKLHLPFIVTFFAHRITNGVAEGINDPIATLQKRAYGYRNFDNFKTVSSSTAEACSSSLPPTDFPDDPVEQRATGTRVSFRESPRKGSDGTTSGGCRDAVQTRQEEVASAV